jgi:Pentapeptide repeats (8 copies)
MADSDRPRSPFAGMADLSARTPVRVLRPSEIEKMLELHQLYLETEYHEGRRANFSSADLTRRDFSGLHLRGIRMDRAVLRGADFTGARLQSANLIGAILEQARLDRSDLSRARLSGANLVSATFERLSREG